MKKISHSRNSVFTLFSWLTLLILTFFATPYIVQGLGNEQYGVYALITGFIAYSFTFNTGRALTKYVSEFNSSGETEKLSKIISATFFLSLTVATIGCSILYFFTETFVDKVFLISSEIREETISGLHAATLCIWLSILGQVFIAIVQAKHRYDISSLISTFINFLLISGNFLLVSQGYGFLSLLIWNAVTLLFNILLFFIAARKLEKETVIKFNFGRDMFKISLKYGLSIAGHQIFANILLLFERIAISRLQGPDDITHYVIPMTISIYILLFVTNLTQNLMPVTSELFAQKNLIVLEMFYRRLTKIVFAILVYVCLFLTIGGYELLANWINPEFSAASYKVFIIHILSYGLLAGIVISWQFIEGFGLPYYNTLNTFFWLIISVPLMFLLTKPYGIEGTALARLLGEVMIPVLILLVERKIFGKLLFDLWLKIILYLGISGIIVGFIEYKLLEILPLNWFSLIVTFIACGIIYLFFLWLSAFFSKEEQLWIGSHVRRIFPY